MPVRIQPIHAKIPFRLVGIYRALEKIAKSKSRSLIGIDRAGGGLLVGRRWLLGLGIGIGIDT